MAYCGIWVSLIKSIGVFVGLVERLKKWAGIMKRDILALYLAGRDPRVPWYAKALAIATAAYALSPIDLIPDFIPVIGYLDDFIILPAAIWFTVWLIPDKIMDELRDQAAIRLSTKRPRSFGGAVIIVTIWLGVAVLVGWLFWSR
jgi:uncharacterized membrane protein YkvA (DUF1232 family)